MNTTCYPFEVLLLLVLISFGTSFVNNIAKVNTILIYLKKLIMLCEYVGDYDT